MDKRHSIRCKVCERFITFDDMLDDEMCEACAARITEIVHERSRILRWIVIVLLTGWLILGVLFLILSWPNHANAFNVEYYVTGVNLTTNERVVGWLDGTLGEANVQGYVLDRGDHIAVVGLANGKGSFELRSLNCLYDVVVTDEVSDNKIENRRTWQEAWK